MFAKVNRPFELELVADDLVDTQAITDETGKLFSEAPIRQRLIMFGHNQSSLKFSGQLFIESYSVKVPRVDPGFT